MNVSLTAGFELWLKSLCRSLSSLASPEFTATTTSLDSIGGLVSSANKQLGEKVSRAVLAMMERCFRFIIFKLVGNDGLRKPQMNDCRDIRERFTLCLTVFAEGG